MLIKICQRGGDADPLRAYWLTVKKGGIEYSSKMSKLGIKDKKEYAESDEYKKHIDQIKSDIGWNESYIRDEWRRVKRMLEEAGMDE